MKLTVEIVRVDGGKQRCLVFAAYVLQDGKRGKDLLRGHSLTNVANARERCAVALQGHEIEFIGEKPAEPTPVKDRPFQTARQRYGWRSL